VVSGILVTLKEIDSNGRHSLSIPLKMKLPKVRMLSGHWIMKRNNIKGASTHPYMLKMRGVNTKVDFKIRCKMFTREVLICSQIRERRIEEA
jgi:hypothetical protein